MHPFKCLWGCRRHDPHDAPGECVDGPRPRDAIASEQAQAFYAIGVKEAQIRILRGEIDALHARAQELNREAAASDTAPQGAAPAGAEGTR